MSLTLKDQKKFIGDQNFIVLYLTGYLKNKNKKSRKSLWMFKDLVYLSNLWYPGELYDLIMGLRILDM